MPDDDDPKIAATGLAALAEIDDIAIVAMPDIGPASDDRGRSETAHVDYLIEHCEQLRYRIAIVDPPADSSMSGVREFRSQFDTKYAALYYPWVQILDPTGEERPGRRAGHPAAAAVRVRGRHLRAQRHPARRAQGAGERGGARDHPARADVTFDRQAVLNPEGINALRFFPGRGNRVWGARTMSSDPEWKYVNVRRLFIYLEHSIDKGTQWAVFEPNNERLWANIRQTDRVTSCGSSGAPAR